MYYVKVVLRRVSFEQSLRTEEFSTANTTSQNDCPMVFISKVFEQLARL